MGSGNVVKHGGFTTDQAEKSLAEIGSKGNMGFMKLVAGRNVVRFIPPRPGKGPFLEVMEHFIRVPGVPRPVVFVCPAVSSKERCPACDKASSLRASGNPSDRDAAYENSSRLRVYSTIIDRKEPEAGPKVLAFGKSIYEQLCKLRKDEDAGGDFTDPVDGFDIVIERTGTGKNDTEYTVNGSRKTSPLHASTDQMNEWIETQPDTDKLVRSRGYDELKTAMQRGEVERPQEKKAIGVSATRRRTADADVNAGGDPDDDVAF